MSNVIKVPKLPRESYNPHRPLHKNLLIAAQVKHFQEAENNLPPEFLTGTDVSSIRTEGQAADYIRKVTQAIHSTGGRAPQKVETVR